MKVCGVIFLICCTSALRKRTASTVYVEDPKHSFHHEFFSDDRVVGQNSRWIEKLYYHAKQANFVDYMINIKNAIPLTPQTAIKILDETPYCWVILTYNSDDDELYSELKELATGLSEYFYERCGVSMLDLGYPSNDDTFGGLVSTPGVILKHPNTVHKMFHHDDIHNDIPFFKVEELDLWGSVTDYDEIGKDPLKVINMIDKIYEGIHSNYKIGAVFMDHYTDGITSPKFYINAIINEILKSLQFKVFESMKDQGDISFEDLKKTSFIHLISKKEALYNKFKIEMHREITELDMTEFLTKTIEDEISTVLKNAGFQQKSGEEFNVPEAFHKPDSLHTSIIAREPEPIESLIPKWLKLKQSNL